MFIDVYILQIYEGSSHWKEVFLGLSLIEAPPSQRQSHRKLDEKKKKKK